MSKNDELISKLSTLSEEEELIFLYYYCEVSKHSLLVDGETGSYAQYQNVSKVAKSLFLPFEMSRQKFNRSAPEIMRMSQQAKLLQNAGETYLPRTMKKKKEAIKKIADKGGLPDAPKAPHVMSHWTHKEFVAGKTTIKETKVTWHRFLLNNMVTMQSLRKHWINKKQLYIEIEIPQYFGNPLSSTMMLIDQFGNPILPQDHADITGGFADSLKAQFGDDYGKPCEKFVINYAQEQDTNEWFSLEACRPGFYLQKGMTRNADGEDCPYKELHVITKEYVEVDEEDQDEITPEAMSPTFGAGLVWSNHPVPALPSPGGPPTPPAPTPAHPVPPVSPSFPRTHPPALASLNAASGPRTPPTAVASHGGHTTLPSHRPSQKKKQPPPATERTNNATGNGSAFDMEKLFQMMNGFGQKLNEIDSQNKAWQHEQEQKVAEMVSNQTHFNHEQQQHQLQNQTQVNALSQVITSQTASRPNHKRDYCGDMMSHHSKRSRPANYIDTSSGGDDASMVSNENFSDASQELSKILHDDYMNLKPVAKPAGQV